MAKALMRSVSRLSWRLRRRVGHNSRGRPRFKGGQA
jgi:hypothetical protein